MSSDLQALIDEIQNCLDGNPTHQNPEVLAAGLAKECSEVNDRLQRVRDMLAAGSETQALQFAESSPRLLDQAIGLSFGRETDWQEYCRENGMEIAPMVNAAQLEELQDVYGRGISSGHPLYKEYRTAALSRDDSKAYELARLIVRMNPSDSNAAKELERLEKKKVMILLESLKQAESDDEPQELLGSLTILENLRDREELEKETVYRKAVERRREIETTEFERDFPRLMAEMDGQLSGNRGDWRDASVIHAGVSARIGRLGYRLPVEDEDRFTQIESRIDKCRQQAEREARIETIGKEIAALSDEVQTRSVTPLGVNKLYANQQLEKLLDLERELNDLRGDLPSSIESRRAVMKSQLEQCLERNQKRRRLGVVTGVVATLVVLVTASSYFFLSFQAGDNQEVLSGLRAEGQSAAAASLVTKLRADNPLLLKFPGLNAEVVSTEKWLETVSSTNDRIAEQLESLEEAQRGGFLGLEPDLLYRRLGEVGELVQELPEDLSREPSTRLTIVRNEAERYLAAHQEKADAAALKAANEVEAAMGVIDFEDSVKHARIVVENNLEKLAPFIGLSEFEAPILRLPSSTESMVTSVQAALDKLDEQVRSVENLMDQMLKADTLEEYVRHLAVLAGASSFKESAQAQKIVELMPDTKRQRAFLLFRGDLTGLIASGNLPAGGFPKPAEAFQLDRDVIGELSSDPFLVELWRIKCSRGGKTTDLISRGKLKKNADGYYTGLLAAYPKFSGLIPEFDDEAKIPGDTKILEMEPSGTMQLMNSLRLEGLLDATGTEYQRSLVPLVDRIFNNQEADSLAKAYVLTRIFRLLSKREAEWGLHLLPELKEDMEAARALEVKGTPVSSDWLVEKRPDWADEWDEYFSQRASKDYYGALKTMLDLVRGARDKPILLAGRTNSDGTAEMEAASKSLVVWAFCERDDGSPVLTVLGQSGSEASFESGANRLLAFSPVFGLVVEDERSRQFLLKLHGIKNTTAEE